MSGDRLSVDLDGLEVLAGELDAIRASMNAMRSAADAYANDLVSHKIEKALGSFEHNWRDGRKKVDGNAERLAGLAREAVQGLHKVDNDLAANLVEATHDNGAAPAPVKR